MPDEPRLLCRLEQILDGRPRVFEMPGDGPDVFVIRKGQTVYAYLNDCPHWNVPLDIVPGRLISRQTGEIQCANHGARFAVETGECRFGPCLGEALTPAPVELRDGEIWLLAGGLDPVRGRWRLEPPT
jgi:nitrite reductase/ring-hydroxylating ferredoxin subunit